MGNYSTIINFKPVFDVIDNLISIPIDDSIFSSSYNNDLIFRCLRDDIIKQTGPFSVIEIIDSSEKMQS